MPRDDATLLDIARAARLASEFTAGMDQAAFRADLKTHSAVLHQLMVMGEAVKGSTSIFSVCLTKYVFIGYFLRFHTPNNDKGSTKNCTVI